MSFQRKSIYSVGIVTGLLLAVGLATDAKAQQASSSFRNRLEGIWSRIVRDDEHREPPQTSRGDLCAIAPAIPGTPVETIWHDQPIIALDPGKAAKVSLKIESEKETFWHYEPSADENHVIYDGEPLVSGQTYVLQLHQLANSGPAIVAEFEILPAATRTLIENGLKIATDKNDPTLAELADTERQAIQRADYLANRGLPYDAIQALFSVSLPSAELMEMQAQILEDSCDSNLAVHQD